MAAARCKAGLIVLGLLAAASGFLQLTAPPAIEEAAAAWLVLPATVNDCAGSAVRFCQNEACGRRVVGGSADERCPACGGPLGDLAPAETKLLPAGTRILRRLYAPPGGLPFTVTVVFGDRERRSIHRPQGEDLLDVLAGFLLRLLGITVAVDPEGTVHLGWHLGNECAHDLFGHSQLGLAGACQCRVHGAGGIQNEGYVGLE